MPTSTGRQEVVTVTPQQGFASMAAEVSAIEHLVTEALVAQEKRLMLRLETASKAQESAELTMARRSARRRGALATTLGVAAGTMLVVFTTAWSVYRDYRKAAESVATQVVEEKASPIEDRLAATESSQADLVEDISALGRRMDQLTKAVSALADELERDNVPQARKRPR